MVHSSSSLFVRPWTRWVTFLSGLYIMLGAGTMYGFAAWSSDFKNLFGLTLLQTNLVGTMMNVGTYASVVAGFAIDLYGSRFTALGAALLSFTGYFGLFICTLSPSNTSPAVLCFFGFLVGQGCAWAYSSTMKPNISNFPQQCRGKIVGFLACFFAFSSGVFTQLYVAFFTLQQYLCFLAIVTGLICLIAGGCFSYVLPPLNGSVIPEVESKYLLRLNLLYFWAFALVFALLSFGLVGAFFKVHSPIFGCILLLILILLPSVFKGVPRLLLPEQMTANSEANTFASLSETIPSVSTIGNKFVSSSSAYEKVTEEDEELGSGPSAYKVPEVITSSCFASVTLAPASPELTLEDMVASSLTAPKDFTLLQALESLNFWLVFFYMAWFHWSGTRRCQ